MIYEKLSVEQQKQMLDQRLAQYEAEHYQHSVNLALLEAQPVPVDERAAEAVEDAKEAVREALKTLDEAHANTKKELKKILDPAPKKR